MLEIKCDSFLLVSSDVHDDEGALEQLSKIAEDSRCLAFLYAGDLNIQNYFISHILRCRNFVFLPVQGNCDNRWDWTDVNMDLPMYRTCSYKGLKIFISHGHLYWSPSAAGLEDKDFDLVVTGHTHRYGITSEIIEQKRVTYLNPGSPSRPRGGAEASYALVIFQNDGSAEIQIRALKGNRLLSKEAVPVHKLPVRND